MVAEFTEAISESTESMTLHGKLLSYTLGRSSITDSNQQYAASRMTSMYTERDS